MDESPHLSLRALRGRLGLTLRDVAETLGVSAGTLSAIESGARGVSEDMLARLETAYGLPAGTLKVPYRPVRHR